MNNKSKWVFAIILLFMVGLFATKPLWYGSKTSVETAAGSSTAQKTDGAKDDGGESGTQNTDKTGESKNPSPSPDLGSGSGLSDLVNAALAPKKPVALVFTYNADCCPTTKEYFDKHRSSVKNLEKKYAQSVNFVWIDIAYYDEHDREGLNSIARKYGVTAVPALVLIDSRGNSQPVIMGEIDEKSVAGKLAGMVKSS